MSCLAPALPSRTLTAAGLRSKTMSQSLTCGDNVTLRWPNSSLGAHTYPPNTGWMLFLTLQHVVSRCAKLLSALCHTVIVPDSCLMRMLCGHCAYLVHLACSAAAAAAATSKALYVVCTSGDAVLYQQDVCSYWHMRFRLLLLNAAGRQ